jgi:insulysin
VRLWFKKDDRFWVPKANFEILLRTPLVNVTPATAVLTKVFTELVDDSLAEYSYNAGVAGLHYNIRGRSDGLQVTIGGYNDKMLVLLAKVLVSMRDLEVKLGRFDIVKERMLRAFHNFGFQEPYQQVTSYRAWLSEQSSWANHQLLAELPTVTAEDIRSFFPQVLRQLHMEILAHGNLSKEDALRTADLIEATLQPRPFPQSQWEPPRNLVVPPGVDVLYQHTLPNPRNANQCVEYTIHVGDAQDRALQAKLLLFAQVVHEPLFDALRTKEQLGYVCGGRPISNGTFDFEISKGSFFIRTKHCSLLTQDGSLPGC